MLKIIDPTPIGYLRDWFQTLETFDQNGEKVRGVILIAVYGDGHIFRADVGSDDITLDDIARMLYALKFTEKRLVDMWDEFTSDVEYRRGETDV